MFSHDFGAIVCWASNPLLDLFHVEDPFFLDVVSIWSSVSFCSMIVGLVIVGLGLWVWACVRVRARA